MSSEREDGAIRCLEELLECYPELKVVKNEIRDAYQCMADCFAAGHKLLIAGNGGSSSDAQHIVGELMKGFEEKRELPERQKELLKNVDSAMGAVLARELQGALPAIALDSHSSLYTAYANDMDGKVCLAQALQGYGHPGDVFLAISTSGNSENILYAAVTAKAFGMPVIALTAKDGGRLVGLSDIAVRVPQEKTFRAQELHLPVYHCWCRMLERHFFSVHKKLRPMN